MNPQLGGAMTPQEQEKYQLQAKAEIERRKRDGKWYEEGARAHVAYQKRPLAWITEKLGIPEHTLRWSLNKHYDVHEWDGDPDPLIKVLDALAAGYDCGVESATGCQKTFTAACIVLWFLACFENSLVITSAPKSEQLLTQIWKEIGVLWPRFRAHFPVAELLTGKIRMRPGTDERETWAAIAFVAGVGANEEIATRAQGFHREHMLIVTEETPGIDHANMDAFQNTRTDDHNLHLALGNPDHRADALHRFCFDEEGQPNPGVVHVRISALDHPNIVCGETVVPGAVGRKRLDQRIARYGKGSRLYQSRIRGLSPAEAADALIRWDWCVAAGKRYADPAFRVGGLALGVDVANSPNGDKAAKARWQGACCTEVVAFACPNATELGDEVVKEARDDDNPIDPRYIGIDSVGVGAATVNECRRQGLKVRHLSGGTKARPGLDQDALWSEVEPDLEGNLRSAGPRVLEAETFHDLRSQAWWRMREDLRLGRVALPIDEELWQDLTTPTYGTSDGKIWVEEKERIIVRLRRSPNKGDACVYGNFVRPRAWLPKGDRTQDEPVVVADRNRDTGLEKALARHAKQMERKERLIRRQFKALGLKPKKRAS